MKKIFLGLIFWTILLLIMLAIFAIAEFLAKVVTINFIMAIVYISLICGVIYILKN